MGRASVAVVGFVVAALATGRSHEAEALLPQPYVDAVPEFRRGDFERAATTLAGWSPEALKRAASTLANEHDTDWRLRAAAAMAHIEVVLSGRADTNAAFSLHVALAQTIVDKLETRDFGRRWYALASSIYLASTDPRTASLFIDRGQRLFKNDARLHMLAGAADEMRSHIADGNVHDRQTIRLTPPSGSRTLLLAESNYRRALELDHTLDEARLRLGRVFFLRNDPKAAHVQLEPVARGSARPRLRYLAHLFLGAVAEYQHDLAGARLEYHDALAICPECQTPYISLTFVEQALGHNEAARDLMARYAALSPDAAADPWWFYQNGGIDEESLDWLRQQVVP
jgi:hypothetical protein